LAIGALILGIMNSVIFVMITRFTLYLFHKGAAKGKGPAMLHCLHLAKELSRAQKSKLKLSRAL
jgi:hypothetical protein